MRLEGLSSLVDEIDRMVTAAAGTPDINDADLRQILRFLAQVIQIVEQAFQDVYTLLIEIKYLEVADLRSPKMNDLRKQLDLLTAHSHYRDAAEICSRLKHLRAHYDEYVSLAFRHMPEQYSGWSGVLGLIEDREGAIINLIEDTACNMSLMLNKADAGALDDSKVLASQGTEELKALLSELHALNGKILGYSGKVGFLELTRNRNELQREVQIMLDKRDQSTNHGPRVQIDGKSTVHGNVVAAGTIQDSFNHVAQSNADNDLKQKLQLLCSQIDDLVKRLPAEKQKEVEQDLSGFVTEVTKDAPRRKWYELSAEGLIDAAKACAGVASPVIATVKQILGLLAPPLS